MQEIVVNCRNLSSNFSGVQRYTQELVTRFSSKINIIQSTATGFSGHFWEQFLLPIRLKNRLLWSPANTGPLTVTNQVLTIHDLSVFESNEGFTPNFTKWYTYLLPRLSSQVKNIITDSDYSKGRIVELLKINPEKIFSIPLGVDGRFQRASSVVIDNTINNLKLPSNRYVLSLGSLEPRKNLKRLLEAWAKIVSLLPGDVWLVIAGSKGAVQIFKDLGITTIPNRVFFTGRIDDEVLPILYSGAMFFVYPSTYEGFGLPPLEAMACGTPSITGNLTSLPEVIGDAGLMIDPYSIEDISEAIIYLTDNSSEREKLSTRGLERVNQFNWDITAEKTWKILNQESL
jgi:glycosyltransferase involved in cell wall biosynthesis